MSKHSRSFKAGVSAVALLIAVVFVLVNLLTDLMYGLVNPRIRY